MKRAFSHRTKRFRAKEPTSDSAHSGAAQEVRVAKWQEENREAFESYNRFIEKHGIWSQKYRSW
jgi:post-segregation antitoxin (ccd killing protein)